MSNPNMSGNEATVSSTNSYMHRNNSQTSLESNDSRPNQGQILDGEHLLEALRRQVEFYFSKTNLQSDGFLVSQMDSNGCVPVNVIAQFAKVRALTNDESMICKALENSTVCTVTEHGIKSYLKTERNTIILREIPSDTPVEMVSDLFKGEGMEPINSVRSDVGDTWFVTCKNEKDAMNNILNLRSKTFNGKNIKARLKGENMLRSFYRIPAAPEVPNFTQITPTLGPTYPLVDGMAPHMGVAGVVTDPMSPYGYPMGKIYPGSIPGSIYHPTHLNGMQRGGGQRHHSGGRRQPRDLTINQGGRGRDDWTPRSGGRGGRGDTFNGRSRSKNREGFDSYKLSRGRKNLHSPTNSQKEKMQPDFSSVAHFPPLSSSTVDSAEPAVMPHVPSSIPHGYQTGFIKYKQDEILDVIKKMPVEDIAKIEEEVDLKQHPLAMNITANHGLTVRQRSISIDEVREHLRRGRPVHQEATLPTDAVDYSTLMFGDIPMQHAVPLTSTLQTVEENVNSAPMSTPANTPSVSPAPTGHNQNFVHQTIKHTQRAHQELFEGQTAQPPKHDSKDIPLDKDDLTTAKPPMGAYAAALLKVPSPNQSQQTVKKNSASPSVKTKETQNKEKLDEQVSKVADDQETEACVQAPTAIDIVIETEKKPNTEEPEIKSANQKHAKGVKNNAKVPSDGAQTPVSPKNAHKNNNSRTPSQIHISAHKNSVPKFTHGKSPKMEQDKPSTIKTACNVSSVEMGSSESDGAAGWAGKRSFLDALKSPAHKDKEDVEAIGTVAK